MTGIAAAGQPCRTLRSRALVGFLLAAGVVLGLGGSAAVAAPSPDPGRTAEAEGASATSALIDIQLLGINDFHGRIESDPARNIAGAAVLAGAVTQLRTENPNTVFLSAGDNVGGTPFTSFIAQDEPTIRALTAAGLEVSSVGNHEFDRGYADLTGRIMPSYASNDLALGANVRVKATGAPALPEFAIIERAGVKIGVIGVVTPDTATAVTPDFVKDVAFTDQLQTAIEVADRIAGAVDVTVLLTHDGSASTDCATIAAEKSNFGDLVRGVSGKVDAVFSGHTHRAYACNIHGLPVVSSGFYGGALGQIRLGVDPVTREVDAANAALIPLVHNGTAAFSADPVVAKIVADAVTAADAQGAQPVGHISASILRGGTPSGSDRGVESSLGNLIADIMTVKVPDADIAVVNPGSLRADLIHSGSGMVTYRDVAGVQPFGNSLVAMTLTGADLRELLEAQWYVDGGLELKRHLSVSDELRYTFDPTAPKGSRIGAMKLRGVPLTGTDTVRIVTNAFLAGGGDGFTTFAHGVNTIDTGFNDLQVTVEYFQSHATVDPPAVGRALAQPQPGPTPDVDPDQGTDTDTDTDTDSGTDSDTDPAPVPTPDADSANKAAQGALANTGAPAGFEAGGIIVLAATMVLGGLLLHRLQAPARRRRH